MLTPRRCGARSARARKPLGEGIRGMFGQFRQVVVKWFMGATCDCKIMTVSLLAYLGGADPEKVGRKVSASKKAQAAPDGPVAFV